LLARKREMGARYSEGLSGLSLQVPFVESWAKSTVWMYAVVLTDDAGMDAKEFANKLMGKGVQTRPFFLGMHEQPVYHEMGLFVGEHYPVTERISKYGVYLPSGQSITNEQIDAVCDAVKDIFDRETC
jgi:perosamine synthetase